MVLLQKMNVQNALHAAHNIPLSLWVKLMFLKEAWTAVQYNSQIPVVRKMNLLEKYLSWIYVQDYQPKTLSATRL